jgi:hypothetical protein
MKTDQVSTASNAIRLGMYAIWYAAKSIDLQRLIACCAQASRREHPPWL